jgi:hypothetical protein
MHLPADALARRARSVPDTSAIADPEARLASIEREPSPTGGARCATRPAGRCRTARNRARTPRETETAEPA